MGVFCLYECVCRYVCVALVFVLVCVLVYFTHSLISLHGVFLYVTFPMVCFCLCTYECICASVYVHIICECEYAFVCTFVSTHVCVNLFFLMSTRKTHTFCQHCLLL